MESLLASQQPLRGYGWVGPCPAESGQFYEKMSQGNTCRALKRARQVEKGSNNRVGLLHSLGHRLLCRHQEPLQFFAQVRMAQAIFNLGLHIAQLVAAVVAAAHDLVGFHPLAGE